MQKIRISTQEKRKKNVAAPAVWISTRLSIGITLCKVAFKMTHKIFNWAEKIQNAN